MRLFLLSLLATGVFASLFLAGRGAFAEDAPSGSYECWYFSTPQPLQNFNLKGGSYTDSSGASGSVAGSGGKMTFSGGNLDGQTAVYKGGNPPTISFVNGNGEQQFFCQLAQLLVVAEQPNRLSAIAFGVFALAAMLPGVAAAKAVPPGRYECWFYTTPQHLKDFTLSGSTYIDASGVSGSVTFSGNKLAFRGGNLDGRTGIYNGGNPPTISFYNADGEEVLLCQRGSWNRPSQ